MDTNLKNIAEVVANQMATPQGETPETKDDAPHTVLFSPGPVINIAIPPTVSKEETAIATPAPAEPTVEPEPIIDNDMSSLLNDIGPSAAAPKEIKHSPLEGNAADDVEAVFREAAVDLPEEEKVKQIAKLRENIVNYKKDLIINYGMTPEQADKAAIKKSQSSGYDANVEWLEEHPKETRVEIDKKGLETVVFTDEEKEKLRITRSIHLVLVEDEELAHITIDAAPSTHKIDFLRRIEGIGSTYSIPCPLYGDMVSFKAASMQQMAACVDYEHTSTLELLKLQSELVYDRLVGGAHLRRWDENSKNILSYDQFMNVFPFSDLDLALFAILVASSTDSTEGGINCESCDERYTFNYNVRSLLKMDEVPDHIKESIDTIVGNKDNVTKLTALHDSNNKVHRFKGSTGNIYDVSYPTLARVIHSMEMIDDKDATMAYRAALVTYMKAILLPNPLKPGHYVKVSEEDMDAMLDSVASIQEDEAEAISKKATELFSYTPKFKLTSTCTHCKKENEVPVAIANLVFLRVNDMGARMQ